MRLAHSRAPDHFVEPELLAFGVALIFLAVMLRQSRSGSRQQFVVAFLAGSILLGAAVVLPRI